MTRGSQLDAVQGRIEERSKTYLNVRCERRFEEASPLWGTPQILTQQCAKCETRI